MIDIDEIKRLAEELGRPAKTLVALDPNGDPFYITEFRVRGAEWFANLYTRFGLGLGTHIRRVHYRIISQETPVRMPDGENYLNTSACFEFLCRASRDARYLKLVEISDFVDQRNPDPDIRLPEPVSPPEVLVTAATLPFNIPDKIPLPRLFLDAERPTPYHIEIWAEKSTVNDILEPLAEQYGLNLQTSLGEMSLTRCRELVYRAAANGERPVRIFYISDFDPGGESMPVATARKIEWVAHDRGGDLDIQLQKIVLTKQQCIDYRLPRTPLKEKESRAAVFEARHGEGGTELDALEALYPGELRSILLAEISRFHDADFPEEWDAACANVESGLEDRASDLAEAITGLQARLDQLRAEAGRLQADAARVFDVIRNEAVEEAPAAEDFDFPEPRDADEWDDPLFDSERDYVDQIDRYKEFQGKRTDRAPRGQGPKRKKQPSEKKAPTPFTCATCGTVFMSVRASQYCSLRCRNKARGKAQQTESSE